MRCLWLFFLLVPSILFGQPLLKPTIGISSIPVSSDAICNIPNYLGDFNSSGLQVGDTAYDFKLYDLSGDSFVLSEKLGNGKPVLLISGSYTCPVFRGKVGVINNVVNSYGGQIDVAVIYTVEAHPTDTSPYFGYIKVTQANQQQGILYAQPQTYGERKNICTAMLQSLPCTANVYLDGPCNNWWQTYGPAPNNAYLIDTNGIVFSKHDWFDQHPEHDIACDIDSLLGLGSCSPVAAGGSFTIEPQNTTVSGAVGSVLYTDVKLINTTASAVNVLVKKQQQNLPQLWETAFCYQVCYGANEDSILIQLPPHDTSVLSVDFFTGFSMPDSGSAKIGFRNMDDVSNSFSQTFRAFTYTANSLNDTPASSGFVVYPNPSRENMLTVDAGSIDLPAVLEMVDTDGKLLLQQHIQQLPAMLNLQGLSCGIYFIRLGGHMAKYIRM